MLTTADVRDAKPKPKLYRLPDGNGLNLEVMPSGTKVWRLFYRTKGKQRSAGLGRWPEVSVEDARGKAWMLKQGLARGVDPQGPLPAEDGSDRFKTVAREWYDAQRAGWTKAHADRVWSRIEDDLLPGLGERGMGQITAPELLAVLRKIEARGAIETAKRIRQYASNVFAFAVAGGKAEGNPAFGLERAMARAPRVQHHAMIAPDGMAEFFKRFHQAQTDPTCKLAMLLTMHTAARTAEVLGGTWAEVQRDHWIIPAARMKMSRDHIIPLTKQTKRILKALKESAEDDRIAPLTSKDTMLHALYKIAGRGNATMHGFRALFSTVANDSGKWSPDAIEMCLAHAPRNAVRAAYNRAQFMDERKRLMVWWSDWLDQREAEGRLLA